MQNPQAMLVFQSTVKKQIFLCFWGTWTVWLDFCCCTSVSESDDALGRTTSAHTVSTFGVMWPQGCNGWERSWLPSKSHSKFMWRLHWFHRHHHHQRHHMYMKNKSHPFTNLSRIPILQMTSEDVPEKWLVQVANIEGDWGRLTSKPLL